MPADRESAQHVLVEAIAVRVGGMQAKRPEGRIRRSRQVGGGLPARGGELREGRRAPRLAVIERERQLHLADGRLRGGDLVACAQANGEIRATHRPVLRIERKIDVEQHEGQGLRPGSLLRLERPGGMAAPREVRPGRVRGVHVELQPVRPGIGRDADAAVAVGTVRDLLAAAVEPQRRCAWSALDGVVPLGIREVGQPQREQVPDAHGRESLREAVLRRLHDGGAQRLLQPGIGDRLTGNVPLEGAGEDDGGRELREHRLLPEGIVGEHVVGALERSVVREGERAAIAGPEPPPRLEQGPCRRPVVRRRDRCDVRIGHRLAQGRRDHAVGEHQIVAERALRDAANVDGNRPPREQRAQLQTFLLREEDHGNARAAREGIARARIVVVHDRKHGSRRRGVVRLVEDADRVAPREERDLPIQGAARKLAGRPGAGICKLHPGGSVVAERTDLVFRMQIERRIDVHLDVRRFEEDPGGNLERALGYGNGGKDELPLPHAARRIEVLKAQQRPLQRHPVPRRSGQRILILLRLAPGRVDEQLGRLPRIQRERGGTGDRHLRERCVDDVDELHVGCVHREELADDAIGSLRHSPGDRSSGAEVSDVGEDRAVVHVDDPDGSVRRPAVAGDGLDGHVVRLQLLAEREWKGQRARRRAGRHVAGVDVRDSLRRIDRDVDARRAIGGDGDGGAGEGEHGRLRAAFHAPAVRGERQGDVHGGGVRESHRPVERGPVLRPAEQPEADRRRSGHDGLRQRRRNVDPAGALGERSLRRIAVRRALDQRCLELRPAPAGMLLEQQRSGTRHVGRRHRGSGDADVAVVDHRSQRGPRRAGGGDLVPGGDDLGFHREVAQARSAAGEEGQRRKRLEPPRYGSTVETVPWSPLGNHGTGISSLPLQESGY